MDSYEKYSDMEDQLNEVSLDQLSREMEPGESLILDLGGNRYQQADEIFDTLIMRGYDVRRSFWKGKNQIVVSKK